MTSVTPLLRLSTFEVCVLTQLERDCKYGLQIVAGSNGLLQRRMIYVLLHRMVGKKLIERDATFEAPTGQSGPTRQLYRITKRGRHALVVFRAWTKAA